MQASSPTSLFETASRQFGQKNSADMKFRQSAQTNQPETIQPLKVTTADAPTCCEHANRG